LMRKQRRDSNELVIPVDVLRPLPCVPGFRLDRMSGRADSQNVDDGELTVFCPPGLEETVLRPPAVREQERVAIEQPLEVHALIDLSCQLFDFRILVEVLAGG